MPGGVFRSTLQQILKAYGSVPSSSTGGVLKSTLPQALQASKFQSAASGIKYYGIFQKIYNAYNENQELTKSLKTAMKSRGQIYDIQLDIDKKIDGTRGAREIAKKGVQSAWQELQDYLRRKAQKAGSGSK